MGVAGVVLTKALYQSLSAGVRPIFHAHSAGIWPSHSTDSFPSVTAVRTYNFPFVFTTH